MLRLSHYLPNFGSSSNGPFRNINHKEWSSVDSFRCSPLVNELPSPGATSSDPSSFKKLNHNASERERRQKLNGLYSTLQSLLPKTDLKKKLSIPNTVSQALKYIPQLQNQVETLRQRKEEILADISKQNKGAEGHSKPTVSTSQIDNREVVIQVCASKTENWRPFSAVLQNLEGDELQIINASAFAAGEDKILYTLHIQAKGTQMVDSERLVEKIISLC